MRSSKQANMSLHKLSVDNPWFSVHPLSWTGDHLKLVGCGFSLLDTISDTATTSAHEDHLILHAERLAKCRTPSIRDIAARELLCQEGSPIKYIEGIPCFSFATNSVHHPECLVFRSTAATESDKNAPVMAGFYHYDKVTKAREILLTPKQHPIRGYNLPVERLYERKREHITPKTWDEDPYLVRLLVTKKDDKTNAHIYHIDMPEVILNNLDHPSQDLKATWPKIYHVRVPFQPYQTLGSRIKHLLSPDYDFLAPTPGATLSAGKRKHHEDETVARSCQGGMARKKVEC